LAAWVWGSVVADQKRFVASLERNYRAKWLGRRQRKLLPANLEFVCVVAYTSKAGDGVVSRHNQWSPDLRLQGIPFVLAEAAHTEAMQRDNCVKIICAQVQASQQRWDAHLVARMVKVLDPASKGFVGRRPPMS
jgi:hypothetical protein